MRKCDCEAFQPCPDCLDKHSDQCADFGPCPVCDKTEWLPIDDLKINDELCWLLDENNLIGKGHQEEGFLIVYDDTPFEFSKPVMFAEIKPPEPPK